MACPISLFLLLSLSSFLRAGKAESISQCEVELLQFALNLEYLETEFFLSGALGHGLDIVAPDLARGGSPPIGGQKANLGFFVRDIIIQFAYQEVGHLREIQQMVGGFPRPLMDLSSTNFAKIMTKAMGAPLHPPFDPYLNDINFLLASYLIPYVGLTAYVGTMPYLNSTSIKRLVASLLAVKSGQDAVIRSLLYRHALQPIYPYTSNVAELTNRLSALRNRLSRSSNKDQGLLVSPHGWIGGSSSGNIIYSNNNSIAYWRFPRETLRILYGTGHEDRPGGFFPIGTKGAVAQIYLANATSACPRLSKNNNH
ncbi:ferritin-like catalase Nec2 [Magnolia sinica]|uniref:ferritin-like catalase Nec2 n=1 Tax=Magnolia sinica TaxID=86752 RepID=UPI00265B5650|nr:ferritin-like catalase Nec2 [Magnolia sinica]